MRNNYSPYTFNIIPPDIYEKAGVRRTALFTGILAIMYIACMLFLGSIFATVYSVITEIFPLSFELSEIIYQIVNMVSYILMMTIPFLIYALIVKIPFKVALPLKRPRPSLAIPAIPITLGASVVGVLISGVLLSAFEKFGFSYSVATDDVPQTAIARVLYIISLSVLPAIFEELAFRGVLMQSLRRHGDVFALLVSSTVFALFHGNFMQLPNAFVLGMMIGFFALRTDSLITGMVMHFFNNFIITVLDIFVLSNQSEMEQGLTILMLYGVYILLGIIGVVFVTLKHKNIYSLSRGYGVMTTGAKLGTFFTQPVMIISIIVMLLICCIYFFV